MIIFRLSRFMLASERSRINRSARIKYEKQSGDTYEVLPQAVEFSRYIQENIHYDKAWEAKINDFFRNK